MVSMFLALHHRDSACGPARVTPSSPGVSCPQHGCRLGPNITRSSLSLSPPVKSHSPPSSAWVSAGLFDENERGRGGAGAGRDKERQMETVGQGQAVLAAT